MNTLIVSHILIGIAVGFQQSFFWVVAEIVPDEVAIYRQLLLLIHDDSHEPSCSQGGFLVLDLPAYMAQLVCIENLLMLRLV